MYAMKQGGEWVQISPHHFRELHPEKLIPDGQLEAEGLHRVETDPRPGTAWNETVEGALAEVDGRPVWQWTVRPMTGDEIASVRAGASLTKTEFLLRAAAAGLLTQADAKLAAHGEVPAAFAAVIAAMPQADRDRAEIIWPAATRIERLDPLIGAVAVGMGITNAQLDALFGLG